LNYDFHTTSEVVLELNTEQQGMISGFVEIEKLKIISLTEEDFEEIEHENFGTKKLSLADKSVFYIARKFDAIILTGDNLLRKVSDKNNFEVHGTLWILESFVEMKIINPPEAVQRLLELMQYNPRLPKSECFKRIDNWSKK
jgi:predicted nucleic acid-binding protein